MTSRDVVDIYPLTPTQEGLLFHTLLAPDSGVYVIQQHGVLEGELDLAALSASWERVVDRQTILRTSFEWDGLDRPLQIVHRHVRLPLVEEDWTDLSPEEQQSRWRGLLEDDRRRGFDLHDAPLMRFVVARLSEREFRFLWSHHHVLADGWSLPLLLQEVFTFYEASRRGIRLNPPDPRPFRDYIAWLERQDPRQAEAFWREQLAGYDEPVRMGIDRGGAADSADFGEIHRRLSPARAKRLEAFAREHQLTLNTLVQAAWAFLLSCYSGREDVVFGVAVSGRSAPLPGIESMIGPFINTLPVRIKLPADATVRDWLAALQAQTAAFRSYEYSPLVKVQRQGDVQPGTPLFEYLYVFENYPVDISEAAALGGSVKLREMSVADQTNYPFMLAVVPGAGLEFRVNYLRDRFQDSDIERLLGHLERLLATLIADPDQMLGAISLISDRERDQVLVEWNATDTAFDGETCLHRAFEAQVQKSPTSDALEFEGKRLTYAELNERANQLAWHLIARGVGPGKLVGVCAERSFDMVVALYGILKAGGGYVPLDPEYPPQRMTEMLEDAQPVLLLTQQHLVSVLPPTTLEIIRLDTQWEEIAAQRCDSPNSATHPLDPAYAIFTSGSTGRPKGVLVPHGGICNRLWWMQREYPLTPEDRVLQKTPYSFDVSVWEFFWPLLCGAQLVIARPDGHRDPEYLVQLIQRQQVTTAHFVPSMLQAFVAANDVEHCTSLRRVICSGEALTPDLVERFYGRSHAVLENLYGPTEASVDVTSWTCPRGQKLIGIPIGRPVANTHTYVLDANLRPVPVDVPGELYLDGVQLALGYLRRPDLTAERFVPNPFGRTPRTRLYRTGDLVRWLSDGTIEFLGRIDHQVKIRGFRIELGEIETVLRRHAGVREAAVVDRADATGRKRLAAYVVLEAGGETPSSGELRDYLTRLLPDYMVPSIFVFLEALPLNANGKLDRKGLPAPRLTREGTAGGFAAPRNDTEETLAAIWRELLGIDRVGVHDNFFALGGHSLLATQLVSRIRERFEVELPLRAMFVKPSIAQLAQLVEEARLRGSAAKLPPIKHADRTATLPLSFAQERLWFLNQLEPGSPFYNVPVAVRIRGKLDRAALVKSLQKIIERHEVLRTTFETVGGYPQQRIHDGLQLPLEELDASGMAEDHSHQAIRDWAIKEALKPFDLARGPLVRACIARIADDDQVFLWTMHHIVSDGWSTGVLVQEVSALYQAYAAGLEPSLPPLPVQYADFAAWQREHLAGEELDRQLGYWKARLAGAPEVLELPTDRPRPAVQSFRGAYQSFELSEALTAELQALGVSESATLFMTLLAAFQTLMSRYSGQQDLCVGTPIAGRNRVEIEPLIGFFVNTLVLRGDLTGDQTFRALLRRTCEATLGAYAHQDLPFEKLVDELQPRRDLGRSPLFQVVFGLHNAPLPAVEAGELKLSAIDADTATVKFDLSVAMQQHAGRLVGRWGYNSDLFDATTIVRMIEHFQQLLRGVVQNPDAPLAQLPLLSEAERRQVLVDWNSSPTVPSTGRCLHEWFEEQAGRTPDATAVACSGTRLTYAELNHQANQLAHHLRGLGVGPESLVGLCLERSADMVVGILGILKAGGAYLPLDPAYPPDRLAFTLADSQACVVVTQSSLAKEFESGEAQVVCLDSDAESIRRHDQSNPRHVSVADNAAYVIYTSGSTGRPKGCVVTHANVTRLFTATEPWYRFDETDIWTLFHSFAFDFSVWELWGALLYGGRVVIVPYLVSRSPEEFRRLLCDERVTVLNQTPSAFQQLMEADARAGAEPPLALKWVIFGGEALQPGKLRPWVQGHGDERPRLVNMYGITETTVHVTYCPLPAAVGRPGPVSPIGRAIPDLQLYVLDASLEPAPIGVPGELYVGGAGVARSYLHRPELTATRFVPNPFGDATRRLYRTGDQARWLPDGTLEFLGRIDQQVKIRGFRVEPGEIETVLAQHPAIHKAAVVARQDKAGQPGLIAYVVPHVEAPSVEALRGHLQKSLPEYMVPAAYVFLDALPLTTNGKLDRRALPEPDGDRPGLASAYVAPRSGTEALLAELVRGVLGVEQVGIHDDFFALGGDSLKGAVLINRVQERVGEIVHVAAIFERPTVAGLAEYLQEHYGHRIPAFLGEEVASEADAPGRRLNETDFARIRSLMPPSRLVVDNSRCEKNPPAVFVLAPPRSGTTLLRVMLAGHSKLFAPPELELLAFNTLHERRDVFSGSRKFWLEGTIRAVMALFECDADEAARRMEAWEQDNLTTQQFYRLVQRALDGRLLVDKTPSYTLDLATLHRIEREFDGAFYLHLQRHPQGMIRSFEKAHLDRIFFPYEHPYTTRELAELLWTVSHQNTLEFLSTVPAERQHVLRFEDLVSAPENAMRRVCAFLGVPFEAGLLDPYDDVHGRMADGPHRESRMLGDVRFREHEAIEPSVADAWKQERPGHPLGTMTEHLARQFGYEDAGLSSMSARIELVDRSRPLPLSFAQERLWFLDQLIPNNPFYNMPGAVRLQGPVDVEAVRRAFGEIVRRHEALRTTFRMEGGRAVQVISSEAAVDVPLFDLTALPETEREAEVRRRIATQARQPFNLTTGPLIRASVYRIGPDDHVLFWALHHIVADGWSLGVLLKEVTTLYAAFSADLPSPLPELAIQYADFAQWQRQWLTADVLDGHVAYWRKQLAGLPVLNLPGDRPRPATQTFRGDSYSTEFPGELCASLKGLSRREGVTLFVALLAGFQTLLSRYTGQEDIVVGSPVAGRIHKELEGLIGFFVNSLVLRTDLSGDPTFRELLARVRDVWHGAYAHQGLPFEKLVEELRPQRDLSREAMFQVALILQNAPMPEAKLSEHLTVSPVEAPSGATRYDLEVHAFERAGRLFVTFIYNTDIFEAATIERMAHHFEQLLQGLVAHPERPLSQIPLLSEEERQQVVCDANDTATPYPSERCIHELFEEQAQQTPQAIAVVFGDTTLTYAEVNAQANQVAHALRARGVGPDSLVALCVERSPEMLVGVLGILKAGGAYVPLDPEYPAERLAFMLQDARAALLLTKRELLDRVPRPDGYAVLCLDDEPSPGEGQGTENLPLLTKPESLAYVIYTSGSTGRPKGIALPHRGICHLVTSHYARIRVEPTDRVLQFSSLSFDASVWEIFPALVKGASLCLGTRAEMIPGAPLVELCRRHHPTVATLPPTALAVLPEDALAMLRTIVSAGEACTPELVARWAPMRRFINAYGPSEVTVCATLTECHAEDERLTIGGPIPNATAFVLDPRLNPVPVGVPGELYVGGAGLARGYLNEPALTAERFVPDPFGQAGERLYRTGDLVRWTPDGNVEFLGRIDHQVKIRGFRIELGEIEAALGAHAAVRDAIVMAREDAGEQKKLVAYIVPDPSWQGQGAGAEDASEQVQDWRDLYEGTYAGSQAEDASFNIVGWQSSYTGEPIPAEEMRTWRDTRVEQLLALRPKRVLEIGCGTGLLLLQIAPHCEAYHGTDFSQAALDYVREALAEEHRGRVTLSCREAADFGGMEAEAYDLVIINSVVQYFPSIEYLREVLGGARRVLGAGGALYVGDVRDLRLLEAYHTDVQQSRARAGGSTRELREVVRTRMEQEKELLIDPAFFEEMSEGLQLGWPELRVQRGGHRNELNLFRYDVLLRGGGDASPSARGDLPWQSWTREGGSVAALRDRLASERPEALGFHDVPNARLEEALGAARLLGEEGGLATVGELRAELKASVGAGVDPEALWGLGESLGYRVSIRCSADPGAMQVLFTRGAGPVDARFGSVAQPGGGQPLGAYANRPLRGRLGSALLAPLRAYLEERLPGYMVPAAFVFLEAWPLTPSGKVDRKALPAPGGARPELASGFVAPRNETEEILAEILRDVLGIDQVGVHDNFFALGGHSLLATQVMSRVRQRFDVDVPLRAIFEEPSVAHLAELIAAAQHRGAATSLPPITVADRTRDLPLSFSQERLWFLNQLDPTNPFYNIPAAVRIRGPLDVTALRHSLEAILRRHEVLRTTFETVDGRARQRVHHELPLPFGELDLSHVPPTERDGAIRECIERGIRQPFDLAVGPLVRATLFRVADDDHVFFWTMHHIISDGWSMGIALGEVAAFYQALRTGTTSKLQALPVQYADFAVWQREYLSGEVLQNQLAFWKAQLTGVPETLALPADRPRPAVPSFRGANQTFQLSATLTKRIHALGQSGGTTPFMTLLAGFQALLGRYTGQEQLCVGTPIAGRNLAEIEPLIGFFVNTLVIRGDLSGRPTFEELLRRTRERTLAAYAHQELPFERLVDELQIRRDVSRNPLFQVMFALQDAPLPVVRLENELSFAPVDFDPGTAQFDLVVSMYESRGRLHGNLKYSTDLFDGWTISRMIEHYRALLEAMTNDPRQRVFGVSLGPGPESGRSATGSVDEPSEFDFAGLGDGEGTAPVEGSRPTDE